MKSLSEPTPRELGFRMPAEWEPHEATWLSWPHNPETWPGRFSAIPPIWIQMIGALHAGEKIHLTVNDRAMEEEAKSFLRSARIEKNLFFHHIQSDDCWMRDTGPVFVVKEGEGPASPATGGLRRGKREVAGIDWRFNKWGGKYPPWDVDDRIAGEVLSLLKIRSWKMEWILEGGSIDVNGRGSLLTTESCLLNKNRNPGMNRGEIEGFLKEYLGVTHMIWLGDGIAGDDTDGHVDDLARFVSADTVVTVVEKDPSDPNFKPLQDNLKRLEKTLDQDGKVLRIVRLPMPRPIFYDGQRLPASYANFYIGNKVVLLPLFSDPADSEARATLESLFPDRTVVGIDARGLVWGLGACHCVTQQQPRHE